MVAHLELQIVKVNAACIIAISVSVKVHLFIHTFSFFGGFNFSLIHVLEQCYVFGKPTRLRLSLKEILVYASYGELVDLI